MIVNDKWLLENKQIIAPFFSQQIRQIGGIKRISYGLSSMGYDIRLSGNSLLLYEFHPDITVDPTSFNPDVLQALDIQKDGDRYYFVLPPKGCALGHSVETFTMPDDTIGLCVGKSTYARCGIIVNVTPLEPGWQGVLTIEITNTSPLPCRIYANEGITQIVFFQSDQPCKTSYDDRAGKYQNQRAEVTLPKG